MHVHDFSLIMYNNCHCGCQGNIICVFKSSYSLTVDQKYVVIWWADFYPGFSSGSSVSSDGKYSER